MSGNTAFIKIGKLSGKTTDSGRYREPIKSKTGISEEGLHFQLAITNALKSTGSSEPIDLVIMHATGTAAGDKAEMQALKAVFGSGKIPPVTSNKFLIGHTLGASVALS